MSEEQTTTKAHVTEWVSTALSPVDSPLHPRRQENRTSGTGLLSKAPVLRRKNRQRRNKARKQRQLAEASKMKDDEAVASNAATKDIEERKTPKDMSVEWLHPEVEEGNVEYKLKIKDPNSVRFQQLVTQMKFRLSEGNGRCYYCVGVADDGYPRGLLPEELQQSIDGVFSMAELLHAKAEIKWQFTGGYGRECAVIKVTRSLHERLHAPGIRIGVIGSVNVGKSTLIACLTNGDDGEPLLDNGQGSARTNIQKHKHEIETGHTSTVSKHFLGYTAEGEVLNYSGLSTMTPAEIGLVAAQRINLIDMGGHEKFLKTVFRGLTSMLPDYVLVCISAATGLTEICLQGIAVALALNHPIIFVLTQTDMATPEATHHVIQNINHLLSTVNRSLHSSTDTDNSNGQYIMEVEDEAQAVSVVKELLKSVPSHSQQYRAPLLRTSAVSGAGLRLLHGLLHAVDSRITKQSIDTPRTLTRFQIDEIIELTNTGSILSGTLVSGTIRVGQQLIVGPNSDGEFQAVKTTTLRCNQVPVRCITTGQAATIAASSIHPISDSDGGRLCDDTASGGNEDEEDESIIKMIRKELREARMNCGVTNSLEIATSLEGNVLLDESIDATTYRSFETVMVLLGGQWPPRGLVSGKWPPQPDSESDSQSGGSFADLTSARMGSCSPLRPKKKHQGPYSVGVYCDGIRQAANIVSIEEITDSETAMATLPASIRAAAAVVSCGLGVRGEALFPCIARVGMHFQLRPEWLRIGSIIIVRDQTQGHLSGIGIISEVQQ